jgi:4-diphosphocytidyl-2-C-methyl-D-erythritol kinase
MPVYEEIARAKVNLTLDVLGRRPDGYHELASLVAFADVGDVVRLDTDAVDTSVTVSGPFAHALVGENLIATTLRRLGQAHPALKLGAVHLDKRLPVAAGIGGGSADAAAVLRAVIRANAGGGLQEGSQTSVPWDVIAASLGADVPVCLASKTSWMTGIGNQLEPVRGLQILHAVLVNAQGAVPPDKTARVFRLLAAPPITARSAHQLLPAPLARLPTGQLDQCRAAVLAFMRERGNGLLAATEHVVPDVADVLRALRTEASGSGEAELAAPDIVAMSGAGPTCFAIYPDALASRRAADVIRVRHPRWWVVATKIG